MFIRPGNVPHADGLLTGLGCEAASIRLRLAFLGRSGRRSSAAQNRNQQQVEVGEHRGPLRSTCELGTADFDLTALGPYKAVELLI